MSLNLDLSNVKVDQPGMVVPKGQYKVICVESIQKPTKDLMGAYIACKFEIVEDEKFSGRFIFHNFNIKNQNQQAVHIALQQLKAFLSAAGADPSKLTSEKELLGLKAVAAVSIKEDPVYGPKNRISYFKVTDKPKKNKKPQAQDDEFNLES